MAIEFSRPVNVVYILGAGFSAPLGLPVMANFLDKAKELYFRSDNTDLVYFKRVFEELDTLSKIKNFFRTDLSNIEEVLSILEMRSQMAGTGLPEEYKRMLTTVITRCTPQLGNNDTHRDTQWIRNTFQVPGCHFAPHVAYFLLGLFRSKFHCDRQAMDNPLCVVNDQAVPPVSYDVITLNYDVVLESILTHITNSCRGTSSPLFFFRPSAESLTGHSPYLVKLHGCVTTTIIPPTWNKCISPSIDAQWKAAHVLLERANHIRVIGYSLPETDTYIRYLLRSAMVESKHLQSFHVICLDKDGSVAHRYGQFVDFSTGYDFFPADAQTYLGSITQKFEHQTPPQRGGIEEGHQAFVEECHFRRHQRHTHGNAPPPWRSLSYSGARVL